MPRYIAIRRQLVPADHEALRDHIVDINHAVPDAQIKWRRLGKSGLELVSVRDYKKATERHNSMLARAHPDKLTDTLNKSIIPKMPTEPHEATLKVDRVGFTGPPPGPNSFANIALLLARNGIDEERMRVTKLLDKLNGVNTPWLTYEPQIVLGTIDWLHADDAILEQFTDIKPATVRVLGAKATLS